MQTFFFQHFFSGQLSNSCFHIIAKLSRVDVALRSSHPPVWTYLWLEFHLQNAVCGLRHGSYASSKLPIHLPMPYISSLRNSLHDVYINHLNWKVQVRRRGLSHFLFFVGPIPTPMERGSRRVPSETERIAHWMMMIRGLPPQFEAIWCDLIFCGQYFAAVATIATIVRFMRLNFYVTDPGHFGRQPRHAGERWKHALELLYLLILMRKNLYRWRKISG